MYKHSDIAPLLTDILALLKDEGLEQRLPISLHQCTAQTAEMHMPHQAAEPSC